MSELITVIVITYVVSIGMFIKAKYDTKRHFEYRLNEAELNVIKLYTEALLK